MIRINIDDYKGLGLENFYYGMLSFIEKYITKNFNPLEALSLKDKKQSDYSLALDTMKYSLKQFLDYLKENKELYISSVDKTIKIDEMTQKDIFELENLCKQYMFSNLNYVFSNNNEFEGNKTK